MHKARYTRLSILALGVFAALCILVVIWIFRRQEPLANALPVTILPGPFAIPENARHRFSVALGGNGRWVSRLENVLFGKRRTVDITATVITLPNSAWTNVMFSTEGEETFTRTNDLKIWFLEKERLTALSQTLSQSPEAQTVAQPRIVSADGLGASMFTGYSAPVNGRMTEIGFSLACAATLRGDLTELYMTIIHSQLRELKGPGSANPSTTETNLNLSARFVLPRGKGLLILARESAGKTGAIAVVVHPLR